MARKSTVLTDLVVPKAPRKSRAKPQPVEEPWSPLPGRGWRVRPLGYGPPSTWPRPGHYCDDELEAELVASAWRAEGLECIVEKGTRGGYAPPSPEPVTVEMLAREGLATRVIIAKGLEVQDETGSAKGQTYWRLSPEGQRRITEAMRGLANGPGNPVN